jgi:hypothetical protein
MARPPIKNRARTWHERGMTAIFSVHRRMQFSYPKESNNSNFDYNYIKKVLTLMKQSQYH